MHFATGRAFCIRGDGIMVEPSVANGVDPAQSSGSTWNNSAWAELTSGFGDDIYILGIGGGTSGNSATAEWEVEIGTGAASSEVVVGPAFCGIGIASLREPIALTTPYPVFVAASTRIAVRIRTSSTSANACRPSDLKLIYCRAQDLGPL